jgi:predicted permease
VSLDPPPSGYGREQIAQQYRELIRRIESIPGVRSATLSGVTPISGAGANRNATVEGYQAKPGELRYLVMNWVAPRYFETYGTPLLAGRDFSFEDQGRPRVAIVNRAMARYYFGDASPIGKHVLFDRDERPYEIVGVVGDAKYQEVRETAQRLIYLNAFQEGRIFSQFSIRTTRAPASIAGEVRGAVRNVVPAAGVRRMTTLADQVDAAIVPERMIVMLSGLFGLIGTALAAVGLYGLLAYTVARRTNEIGVRMALGATREGVIRMVLRDGLRMVFGGMLAGVPIAFWGRSFATSMIEDLRPSLGAPLAGGGIALIAIALVASWAPARRAAGVNPVEALRRE